MQTQRRVSVVAALGAVSGVACSLMAGFAGGPSGDKPPSVPSGPASSTSGKPGVPPTPAQPKGNSAPKALVPFPSPLITEVLYAVPTGTDGDANGDGVRQVSGDEFVEVVNPHDRAIDLKGWTISDKRASEKNKGGGPLAGAVRFTFPPCMLKPGQTAVVFNGYGCTWGEEVGDGKKAPPRASAKFSGALVFSAKNVQERSSFSNTADWVLLSDPMGKPVQLIRWGSVEGKVDGVLLEETAPSAIGGSVQRSGLTGALEPHREFDGLRFSPGLFDNPLADGFRKPGKPAAPTGGDPAKNQPPKVDEPSPTPGDPEEPAPSSKPETSKPESGSPTPKPSGG